MFRSAGLLESLEEARDPAAAQRQEFNEADQENLYHKVRICAEC